MHFPFHGCLQGVGLLVLMLIAFDRPPAFGQQPSVGAVQEKLCVGFYNVENLFDHLDDPITRDEEFTPNGSAQWTQERYQQKLHNVARVVLALHNGKGADLLGLAEVENAGVLNDLIKRTALRSKGYRFIHHDAPDERGIDVALLYRKDAFHPLTYRAIPVPTVETGGRPTRDILLIQGIINKHDTLFIFLNHWPSRRGGIQQTEPRRHLAAQVLRRITDSLLAVRPNCLLLIMGDFNDNPQDISLAHILGATPPGKPGRLINCVTTLSVNRESGTEWYSGKWYYFIQIIVSPAMAHYRNSDICGTFTIFRPDWIMKPEEKSHKLIPMRSIEKDGRIGFSDHLPVYVLIPTGKR